MQTHTFAVQAPFDVAVHAYDVAVAGAEANGTHGKFGSAKTLTVATD